VTAMRPLSIFIASDKLEDGTRPRWIKNEGSSIQNMGTVKTKGSRLQLKLGPFLRFLFENSIFKTDL